MLSLANQNGKGLHGRLRERQAWKSGGALSVLVHLLVIILLVRISPSAAVLTAIGDGWGPIGDGVTFFDIPGGGSAAPAGPPSAAISVEPLPAEPLVEPTPVVSEVIPDEIVPEVIAPEVVAETPPVVASGGSAERGSADASGGGGEGGVGAGGSGTGVGTGIGSGTGSGTGGGGGSGRVVTPVPVSLFPPRPNDALRGREMEVLVFVNERGQVVADSTRLTPPTNNSNFNREMEELAATWRFRPARLNGVAVGAWFTYVIRM